MIDESGIGELTEVSQAFARELLARFPDLAPACSIAAIEGIPGRHLVVQVRSPAGPDRDVGIWMERGDEPSLWFGPTGWHVHLTHHRLLGGGYWEEESLLDLLDAILHDQFVVAEDPDCADGPYVTELDLRDPEALLDELTSPRTERRLLLKTFSGRGDREVDIADFAR